MKSNNALLAAIAQHPPTQIALRGQQVALSYAALASAIEAQLAMWQTLSQPRIGLAVENHPAWMVLDLAAMAGEIPLVPIPFFFSSAQCLHAMQDAGVNILVTDQPQLFEPLLSTQVRSRKVFDIAGKQLFQFELSVTHQVPLPAGTAKITYTSGTTGNPKGVCLSVENMLNVAQAIAHATALEAHETHLSVLPLATLLENVAGVYVTLLTGATSVLLPSAEIGLTGATGLNVQQLVSALTTAEANTAIFTPELLHALVCCLEAGVPTPPDLRFLAVGGASVSPALLQRAQALRIPVFEGYGLSECASVVALNLPTCHKIGTVGKVLPHLQLSFTTENEIVVTGNAFLGYVGQAANTTNEVHTGDIGELDADGFLSITGRKKNIFITSFGRNVSPEWVERELKISSHIAQAALFGEAKPWNVAVIVPRANASDAQISHTIDTLNTHLPDYARIGQWLRADAPFTLANQQLTANGRNRRDIIWQSYEARIQALYDFNEKETR